MYKRQQTKSVSLNNKKAGDFKDFSPRKEMCIRDSQYSYLEDIRDLVQRNNLPEELYNLDILDGSPPWDVYKRQVLDQQIEEQKKRNELEQLKTEQALIQSRGLTKEILFKQVIDKWDGTSPLYGIAPEFLKITK